MSYTSVSVHRQYTACQSQPHGCFHTHPGPGESEAGITIYEDVNADAAGKVSRSVLASNLLFKVPVFLREDFRSFF